MDRVYLPILSVFLCRDFPAGEVEPDWDDEDGVISNLVLLGIVGIQDPVRTEVSRVGPDQDRGISREGIG